LRRKPSLKLSSKRKRMSPSLPALSVQSVFQLGTDTFCLKKLKQAVLFALRTLLTQQQTLRTRIMAGTRRKATSST
jgi:hypothetical protein